MSFMIPSADSLVTYLKDFTGSSNDAEIKQAIFQAELMLRNIELPSLRSDPYAAASIGTVGQNSLLDIPADMNKPILFFQTGSSTGQPPSSGTGPWIVYDRVGDRDIITLGLVAQFYLNPVNVPAVVRGKFSEVGDKYQFVPWVGQGTQINMYYYKAWNLLFTPTTQLISSVGDVSTIAGSGSNWTALITDMTTSIGLEPGDEIDAFDVLGSIGTGTVTVTGRPDNQSVNIAVTGTTPIAGSIANIQKLGTVQTNPVLQTFPEGYVYGALHEYYVKRHSPEDAQIYKSKFDLAVATVEDQNNLGKWSGGNTKITSIFQPRRNQNYTLK